MRHFDEVMKSMEVELDEDLLQQIDDIARPHQSMWRGAMVKAARAKARAAK